ncbi:MAG: glycosyltransferase [Oscillospiraceae bacterium]|nr:glycosyltransferase [Oscillospiraceae bacterium]
MKVSVIVPCYNSTPILRTLVEETKKVLSGMGLNDHEFVLVNDCSPNPDTIGFLKSIADEFPCVKLVDLAKNTGQANAQVAALNYVTGDVVINMDDDMQTHPKNIPILLKKLEEGYDLVLGRYPHKRHSLFRNFLTKADDVFEHVFINKPKDVTFTSFWVVRRYIVDEIVKYKNPYSFMVGLFSRTAGRITNVEVEHFERAEGTSGYNIWKLIKLWSNFTGFTIVPLRIAGAAGLMMAAAAFVWAVVLLVQRLTGSVDVAGYASMMCMMLLFFGITLACMGLMGEYIGRIFMSVNGTPQYVVKEIYHGSENE